MSSAYTPLKRGIFSDFFGHVLKPEWRSGHATYQVCRHVSGVFTILRDGRPTGQTYTTARTALELGHSRYPPDSEPATVASQPTPAPERVTFRPGTNADDNLRASMQDLLFVPGPRNDAEIKDFATYLEMQGVPIWWSEKHPGGFSADRDLCPYTWTWRENRGEVEKTIPDSTPLCPPQAATAPALKRAHTSVTFHIGEG